MAYGCRRRRLWLIALYFAAMPDLRIGVVDVYVIRPYRDEWLVLALQRSLGTRCPASWETVHGRIESGERPEEAAVRELREEAGLAVDRLYSITCQPFYLHNIGVVQMAVVFAAFVREPGDVTIGDEHQRHEWLPMAEAARRFTWPREREALQHIAILLGSGDAGPAEDVLRVI
jgi:dihydroneopterin triphosphate diphosphatase